MSGILVPGNNIMPKQQQQLGRFVWFTYVPAAGTGRGRNSGDPLPPPHVSHIIPNQLSCSSVKHHTPYTRRLVLRSVPFELDEEVRGMPSYIA